MSLIISDNQLETLRVFSKEDRAEVLMAVTGYMIGEEIPVFTGSKLIMFQYLIDTQKKSAHKSASYAAEKQRKYRERKKAREAVTNAVTNEITTGNANETREFTKRKEAKERNSLITPEEVIYISPEKRECAFISETEPEADIETENEIDNDPDFEETPTEPESETDFDDITEENDETEESFAEIAGLSLTKEQARKLAEAQERLNQARRERRRTASEPARISAINTAKPFVEETAEPEPYAERKAKAAEAETAAAIRKRFQKPTFEEVSAYCKERNNYVDPQAFIDFYESKGWIVGKTPMKDWRAAVRTWEKRESSGPVSAWGAPDKLAWQKNNPHFGDATGMTALIRRA